MWGQTFYVKACVTDEKISDWNSLRKSASERLEEIFSHMSKETSCHKDIQVLISFCLTLPG